MDAQNSKRGRPPKKRVELLRAKAWQSHVAARLAPEGQARATDYAISEFLRDPREANQAYAWCRWRLGQNGVSEGSVDVVERKLPGTKLIHEFGPEGCPLWASITGSDLCHCWEATRRDPMRWYGWAIWRYTDGMGNRLCLYDDYDDENIILSAPPSHLFRDKFSLYELMYEIIKFQDESTPLIVLCALLTMSHLRETEIVLFRENEIESCLNKYAMTISDVIYAAHEFKSKIVTLQDKLTYLDNLYETTKKLEESQLRNRMGGESMGILIELENLYKHYSQSPADFLPSSLSV